MSNLKTFILQRDIITPGYENHVIKAGTIIRETLQKTANGNVIFRADNGDIFTDTYVINNPLWFLPEEETKMKTEESAINNEAIKEHKFAMSAVNTETYDLLKRIKPYIETIKICELKCNRFTDADKTAKGILEEVIKINKQHIVQILEL